MTSEKNAPDEFHKLNKSMEHFEKARRSAIHGAKQMSDMIKDKILDITLKESTFTYEKNINSTYNKLVDFQKEVKSKQDKLNTSLQNFLKVASDERRSTTTR